jgi:hypothetical protein
MEPHTPRQIAEPGGKEPRMGKRRLFMEWLAVMVLGTALFTAIALYWHVLNAGPDSYKTWSEYPHMMVLSPIGWLLFGLFPGPLWVSLCGLFLTLWKRDRRLLVISAGGAIWFGVFWPEWFWAMMSV